MFIVSNAKGGSKCQQARRRSSVSLWSKRKLLVWGRHESETIFGYRQTYWRIIREDDIIIQMALLDMFEERCTVWKHVMRCSISKKARRGNNLQAQTSRLCRTSKKKAPKVKRKVLATAGRCSPSLLSAEGCKVWLLMMTMRMTMRMIIIAMRMKMKGEHDCSFDHLLTWIWLTLFHAGRRRRKESADQWSPQKNVGDFSPRNQFRLTSHIWFSPKSGSTEWFLGSVRSLGFGIYSTMAWGFRWI